MTFIYKLSFLLVFIVGISCSFTKDLKDTVIKIDAYPTLAENKQFVEDVLGYNHPELLKERLNITDPMVLKGAHIKTKSIGETVRIEIEFHDAAIVYSKELSNYFTDFFKEKEKYYKANASFLKIAENDVDIFIKWIIDSDSSAIWNRTSSILKEQVEKNQFIEMLSGLSQKFEIGQKKTLNRRILYENITGQGKMFVTIIYDYENGNQIEITLQNEGANTDLVGFYARNHKMF